MISVRRIRLGEGQLFKEMRLASLSESPEAFSSTYESAVQRTWESWCEQADGTAVGSARATFIAFSDSTPVGIGAIYRDPSRENEGEMLQIWVAPDCRGSGIAQALINTLIQWCRENGICAVWAVITGGNRRARRFYEKCGFEPAEASSRDSPGSQVLVRYLDCGQAIGADRPAGR
jgi:GNAT superfamily N-acetyltransferase